MTERKLCIAVIGIGGAVGTTMVAGIELIKKEKVTEIGLPLSHVKEKFIDYRNISFCGWDLLDYDLEQAARLHKVLTSEQIEEVKKELGSIKPFQAIADSNFLSNFSGQNTFNASSHMEKIEKIRADIRLMKQKGDSLVVLNLASTEKLVETEDEVFSSLSNFEKALSENSKKISPAMLYAYAAISERVPYANFTPSVAVDIPAMIEFAEKMQVPIAGKDGKTGQTFIKTVIAPALKARALKVIGWYSTNLLGNRDGLVLSNQDSLASKVKTKSSVLEDILGYEVEDHIVDIKYYPPRGDNKEAWDNIDFLGFLEQPMQIKINFLCRDSILAAPLAIEIARCLEFAERNGEKGIQEQLSVFFKSPMTKQTKPEQSFHKQVEMLEKWVFRS
ncbi:MAG: inositol-3-phosphate synthase [Acidobacteriota bacterium]|nr:inositol-3-phosphate synthase [Pyrinomonadaceae bacterium]MDW8303268.1 inositol-3-phosphate synthase [Acidobacteriota bacterium]